MRTGSPVLPTTSPSTSLVALLFLLFFFGKLLARAAEGHALIGVDHFDLHFAEDRHNVVDLVRRDDLRGQHVVHIVVGEIALLLAQIDELFHLLHVFLLHRLRGGAGGGLGLGYRTGGFGASFWRSSWRSFRTRSCHSSILSLFAFSSFCSSAARIAKRKSRSNPLRCRRRK